MVTRRHAKKNVVGSGQPTPVKATPGRPRLLRHLRTSDLRGMTKLAIESTQGIRKITEDVHQAVLGTTGVAPLATATGSRAITGLAYQSISGATRLIAHGIDGALQALQPLFERFDAEKPETPERANVIAILNGVMGDRLAATGNPLATSMQFWHHGNLLCLNQNLVLPKATGKVAVLIHGLCLNEQQWRVPQGINRKGQTKAVDMAESLQTTLGYTPICLRYNSGLPVSQNGRELALKLKQLLAGWPQPVKDLTIVGYSMGGLVARSACHFAKQGDFGWLQQLRNLVLIASPHHGAPLEKVGSLLDALLGTNTYSAPFGKLLKLRSAGITDLRYGHVLDEEGAQPDRFQRRSDSHIHVPLPEGVNCFAIAATVAARRSKIADRLTGDGLVPLRSALGEHDNPERTLQFDAGKRALFYQMNHLELPRRPEIVRQVVDWLR